MKLFAESLGWRGDGDPEDLLVSKGYSVQDINGFIHGFDGCPVNVETEGYFIGQRVYEAVKEKLCT